MSHYFEMNQKWFYEKMIFGKIDLIKGSALFILKLIRAFYSELSNLFVINPSKLDAKSTCHLAKYEGFSSKLFCFPMIFTFSIHASFCKRHSFLTSNNLHRLHDKFAAITKLSQDTSCIKYSPESTWRFDVFL